MGAALDCLLHADAAAAFAYAERALEGASPGSSARAVLRDALLQRAAALAGADGGAAAALVLRHFPDDHPTILAALAPAPDLQFAYLRGAFGAAAHLGGGSGGVGGEGQGCPSSPSAAAPTPAHARLLADAGAGDAFVRLLCAFEHAGLLPFLQSPAAYRAEVALREVQAAGEAGAEAFLLERLGDVAGAAAIHHFTLQRAGASACAAVAAKQDPTPHLRAARAALDAAVGLCRRHAADLPAGQGRGLWLSVLDAAADLLAGGGSGGREKGVAATPVSPVVRAELAALVDAAVAAMAGHVPLRLVGDRIMSRASGEVCGVVGRTHAARTHSQLPV